MISCYIDASSKGIDLPLGLGSRHVAAASITRDTQAVAVVVSESSVVRIFNDGRLIAEIIPEIWLLSKESIKITGPRLEEKAADLRIVSVLQRTSTRTRSNNHEYNHA